ncbi:MAG: hypothetical protein LC687_01095 [Actinobacteria bacterium]|nr:hypothetical protein [Actinomycetota bacterium]
MPGDSDSIWNKIDELRHTVYDIRVVQAVDRSRIKAVEERAEKTLQEISEMRADMHNHQAELIAQLKTMNDYQQRQIGKQEEAEEASKLRSWLIPLLVSTVIGAVMWILSNIDGGPIPPS